MIFGERLKDKPADWSNDRVHFLKYTSAQTAKIVLRNGTLRWSTPSTLNDPFDVQFDMDIKVDRRSLKDLSLERIWKVYSGSIVTESNSPIVRMMKLLRENTKFTKEEFITKFESAYDEGFERMTAMLPSVHEEAAVLMSDVKILCLTTNPTNTLMWSHYADSHHGVILRFRSIPAFDSPYGMAKPMDYVKEIPQLLDEEFLANMYAGLVSMDTAGIMDKLIYTKSVEWSYENEWRIHSGSGRTKAAPFEDVPFGVNEVDGIIFGLRTKDEEKTEIKQLAASYPNIQFLQAHRSRSSFQISIEEI